MFDEKNIDSDYSEFAEEAVQSYKGVLNSFIDKLDSSDDVWEEFIEPLYDKLKKNVIEKTEIHKEFGLALYKPRERAKSHYPKEPFMIFAIYFAVDDSHEVVRSLEDIFIGYGEAYGVEALDEIPKIWESARKKLLSYTGEIK